MTKNWIEMNDDAHGTYYKNNQIQFKTTILKSRLRDQSNVQIFVKGAITIKIIAAADDKANNTNKMLY